jgi:predicted nucleotidyltransferase
MTDTAVPRTSMEGLSDTERGQLGAVVRLVRDLPGDAAIGAYLTGSAVTSGLRPDSDLDILVVSSRRTTAVERRTLIDGLLLTSRSRGDTTGKRNLEVTVVVQADIRPWCYPPPMELQYGDWWRTEFETSDREPWTSPNPDLTVLLTAARARSLPLFGPPIDDLIEPVPREDLGRAMRDVVPGLMAELEDDVRNVLLTLARVWFTVQTGEIAAKEVAAAWAMARLPGERGEGLRRARAGYLGGSEDSWDDEAMAAARADAAAIAMAIRR